MIFCFMTVNSKWLNSGGDAMVVAFLIDEFMLVIIPMVLRGHMFSWREHDGCR